MKVLVVGAGEPLTQAILEGLDRVRWTVIRAERVVGHGRLTIEALADAIARDQPSVIYSSSVTGPGLLVAAARELAKSFSVPWLTSVRGYDLMPDYQEPDIAERVHVALSAVDGVLAFSQSTIEALDGTGFRGHAFPVAPLPLPVDVSKLPRLRRAQRGRPLVVVDGRQGRLDRGLMAIAGIGTVAERLIGRDIVVVNCHPDVAISATVLGTDKRLRVKTLSPLESTPSRVLSAHARAAASLRLSLEPDFDWFDIAAMASGSIPLVSTATTVDEAVREQVSYAVAEADEPAAIGSALARLIGEADGFHRARTRNAALVRRHFNASLTATLVGYALNSIVLLK